MKESPLREELRAFRQEMRDFRTETQEEFRVTRREVSNHTHGQYITWAAGGGIFAALVVGIFQVF